MKTSIQISILILFTFLFACSSGPCDNIDCNNGTCNEGICSCEYGYTGTNCDEIDLIGTFFGKLRSSDNCSDFEGWEAEDSNQLVCNLNSDTNLEECFSRKFIFGADNSWEREFAVVHERESGQFETIIELFQRGTYEVDHVAQKVYLANRSSTGTSYEFSIQGNQLLLTTEDDGCIVSEFYEKI